MKNYDTSKFRNDLDSLGISLKESQIEDFLIYYEMLIEWNKMMNLTAITEYDEVMKKIRDAFESILPEKSSFEL